MSPIIYVERHERRELTCAYCCFTLDVQRLLDPSRISEGYALIAEDSKYMRNIILNVLKISKFSANVLAFENGLEFTTTFSRLLSERASIDVAIIDLNMPIMDGLTAARTIRAIEAQHKVPPVPIVFFSAIKADDSLRTQMEILSPASYVNKGSDPDPDRLAERVEQLVGYLMEKYKKQISI